MGGRGPADHGTSTPPAGTLDDVLARIDRLRAETPGPHELARSTAELREAVFQLVEDGQLDLAEARRMSRALDEVAARALEAGEEPARALETADQASSASLEDLPRLALEGSAAADTAALLVPRGEELVPVAEAGFDEGRPAQLGAPGTIAAEAAARREPIHLRTAVRHPLALAEGLAGTRALFAVPLVAEEQLLGVLRLGSRTAYEFTPHELSLFRALAARATALLAPSTHEARARHALRTFESLVDAAPLPIVAFDKAGVVRTWNRAAADLFGWSADDVIGRPNPAVDADDRAQETAILGEVHAGAIIRDRPIRRRRRDGAMVDIALSAAPLLDSQGNIVGSIAILIDVSARTRSEAQVERTARFREHFLGIVGHDLRNPLNAIVTSAQLLLRYSALDERQRRVVNRIAQSADRMVRMIQELLDFTRTRLGGSFPITTRRVDLREICEQCVEEVSLAHPDRPIDVRTEGDLWGDWDPGRLAQVISNLVANAVQHSPEGTPVSVLARDEGDTVLFETHNEGPRIREDLLPHVFEPGRRGEGVRTAGLGLGLYIAREIVQAHGGTIEAKSIPGDGTLFTVRLPRKQRQRPSLGG